MPDRRIIYATGVCMLISIIILITVLVIELKPTPLAVGSQCVISTMPSILYLQQAIFSWGYQINIYTDSAMTNRWGYVTSTINANPFKNTYELKSMADESVTQVQVSQNIYSFTTNFEFTVCDNLNENIVIEQTITESIMSTLSNIYTSFNIYNNNTQIGYSNKLSLIDTNMELTDMNNNVLGSMTRSFLNSFIIDNWYVVTNENNIIDNWVSPMVASLVTIKKSEQQNNDS